MRAPRRLRPAEVALIGAMNAGVVTVARRPVVAVVQARARISGMRVTSSISTAHFAMVPKTAR